MRETWVRSLGREDPLEEGIATHSRILAWRIPWTEEPSGLQSMGLRDSVTTERLSTPARPHYINLTLFWKRCGSQKDFFSNLLILLWVEACAWVFLFNFDFMMGRMLYMRSALLDFAGDDTILLTTGRELYRGWLEFIRFAQLKLCICCWKLLLLLTPATVQFSSVTQSWPTLCDPMDCSTPDLPVHHQLPELAQTR